tara:strand:+ start:5312 stop:5851 length:540 start_codon:yes stop_codon:yes gene_type:complete
MATLSVGGTTVFDGATLQVAAIPVGMPIKKSYYPIGRGTCTSAQWPNDDTVPQKNEGTEVFTQAYTPSTASCDLIISVIIKLGETSNVTSMAGAGLFISDNTSALQIQDLYNVGNDNIHNAVINLSYKMASWGTSSKTFSIDVHGSNAYNYANEDGAFATAKWSADAYKSSMIIEEIAT